MADDNEPPRADERSAEALERIADTLADPAVQERIAARLRRIARRDEEDN